MRKTKSSVNKPTATSSLTLWHEDPVLHPIARSDDGLLDIYKGLDTCDAHILDGHATKIATICDSANWHLTAALIEVGGEFAAAKMLLAGRGRDGHFRPWCMGQGHAMSSVYRAIDAYEVFQKCPTLGHFAKQAIYLLSTDSCPQAATEEAIQRAATGEFISPKLAREIVAKYTTESNEADANTSRPHAETAPSPAAKGAGGRKRLTQQANVQITSKGTTNGEHVACEVVVVNDGDDGAVPASSDSSTIIDVPATAVGDAAVAIDDAAIGNVAAKRRVANNGLLGLKTVAAALESLGIHGVYQEDLDRIRIALEQHAAESSQENEEMIECIL